MKANIPKPEHGTPDVFIAPLSQRDRNKINSQRRLLRDNFPGSWQVTFGDSTLPLDKFIAVSDTYLPEPTLLMIHLAYLQNWSKTFGLENHRFFQIAADEILKSIGAA